MANDLYCTISKKRLLLLNLYYLKYLFVFLFVLVGDCNVGKTELLKNHPNKRLIVESEYFNRYELSLAINEKSYKLIVDDIKGYSGFEGIRKTFTYPSVDVFIVAYSITSEDSFNSVSSFVSIINE
jgi:GTPase SAR1 family protein